MIDMTPVATRVQHAYEEIEFARELYNSGVEKKMLQANLHYKNAMSAANLALEKQCDVSVAPDMRKIIEECESHLPKDLEAFIEKGWEDHDQRCRQICHTLFGDPITDKADSVAEIDQQFLTELRRLYEKFPTRYGFLTQERLVDFFNNPNSIYNNGNLWNSLYGTRVCYTDPVLEFDIMMSEYCNYCFYKSHVEGAPQMRFGEVWSNMRHKYLGGKEYAQIDELIADGRLEQFTAEEVMSAIHFCAIYKERYCQGHFLDCCEDGIIGKLLLRLKNVDV